MRGIAALANLAEERCQATGHEQYVADDGTERWENVPIDALVTDVREELADAFAYIVAIAWRTHNPEWLSLFPLLALLWEKLETLSTTPEEL